MSGPAVLATSDAARGVVEDWSESLVQVLESMTDQRAEAELTLGSGPVPDSGADSLWWEQPLSLSGESVIWVGATRALWEHSGSLTLQVAGLDTMAELEIRNTWAEILGQSLGVLARSIGSAIGREVTCDGGAERPPDVTDAEWGSLVLRFPDGHEGSLVAVFAPALLEGIASPPEEEPARRAADRQINSHLEEEEEPPLRTQSRTMGLLLDVDLPISISFGKTRMQLKDVLKLATGSIVELNRGVNEPVEVLVNDCLIARGEVVVVEGNYGVRIQEIATRQERMRSFR